VQGAPTSPGLCNAIVHKLDRRIAALAKRAGFAYTRYADDLTLSGHDVDAAHRLRKQVERVVTEEGFAVNVRKTRVMSRAGQQRVTGVTVNDVLGLSRKERRTIRAMLHRDEPAERRKLEGMLAYVQMLNPAQADALRRSPRRAR
jgi:RNA-directed DNA polymerase